MSKEFIPTSADLTEFKRQIKDWAIPYPFLRTDLPYQLGYTDGSQQILRSPSFLDKLPVPELQTLLDKSGLLLDPKFTLNHTGLTSEIISWLSKFSTRPDDVILIGSRARLLAYFTETEQDYPVQTLNQILQFYRTRTNLTGHDCDFRISQSYYNRLIQKLPYEIYSAHPSRTYPEGQIIQIQLPSYPPIQMLCFSDAPVLSTHLLESSDFPEGVFAIPQPNGLLQLHDPFGSALMQPRSSHPPYPEQLYLSPPNPRLIRNALRAVVFSSDYNFPPIQHSLALSAISAEEQLWQDLPPETELGIAKSVTESFLTSIHTAPNFRGEHLMLSLFTTGLHKVIIEASLRSRSMEALSWIYQLTTEMLEHWGTNNLLFDKFYQGPTAWVTPEEIIKSCEKLADFHPFFFKGIKLSPKSSCYTNSPDDLTFKQIDLRAKKRNIDFLNRHPGYDPSKMPWPETVSNTSPTFELSPTLS